MSAPLPLPTGPGRLALPMFVNSPGWTRRLPSGPAPSIVSGGTAAKPRGKGRSIVPVTTSLIRADTYRDSVELMRVAALVERVPGVRRAALMMATPANRELLAGAGLLDAKAGAAGPNDLVVAVSAADATAGERALAEAARLLDESAAVAAPAGETPPPGSIAEATGELARANLAIISTPGPYATAEALKALKRGLHVFIFSDNVSVADEVELKRLAAKKGRLVHWPPAGVMPDRPARRGPLAGDRGRRSRSRRASGRRHDAGRGRTPRRRRRHARHRPHLQASRARRRPPHPRRRARLGQARGREFPRRRSRGHPSGRGRRLRHARGRRARRGRPRPGQARGRSVACRRADGGRPFAGPALRQGPAAPPRSLQRRHARPGSCRSEERR